ncbi:MAG TPA: hypothetical protein P5028_03865, partial [Candidatus Marinimicrobia bacterium]|nr:hypothetical protein [Candidatus Neomarinimicrobiota bacterium]HRS91166.1 hypothetical protein [Candidatus Neomarinimicrobiota bacterium]
MLLVRNFLIIIVLLFLSPVQVNSQEKDLEQTIEYQSEQLEKIRKEIRNYKSDLKKVESKEKSILTQIDETERSISLTEKLIA